MGRHDQYHRALLSLMMCLLFIAIGPAHAQDAEVDETSCAISAKPTALQRLDDGRNEFREQIGLAVWSPNGERLAVWMRRTTNMQGIDDLENWLQVWDAVRGVKIVELQFNQYYPANITWAADNAKLALAARNRVYIWEGGHNWSSTLLEIDHSHRFEQVVWSADGTQLFTTNVINQRFVPSRVYPYANILRRWDATTGELLEESEAFEQVFVTTWQSQIVAITRLSEDVSVRVLASDEVLFSLPNAYFAGSLFTDNKQRVATVTVEDYVAYIAIWDLSTQQALLEISGKYFTLVNFAPNGDLFQISLLGGGSEIWELETGRRFELPLIGSYQFDGAQWSPDSQCAIFRGVLPPGYASDFGMAPDEVIALWSAAEPERVRLLDGATTWFWGALGGGVAWSPDGRRFTSVDEQGVFKIWQRE